MPKKCKHCGRKLRDWRRDRFKLCLYCYTFGPRDPLYEVRELFQEISEDAKSDKISRD